MNMGSNNNKDRHGQPVAGITAHAFGRNTDAGQTTKDQSMDSVVVVNDIPDKTVDQSMDSATAQTQQDGPDADSAAAILIHGDAVVDDFSPDTDSAASAAGFIVDVDFDGDKANITLDTEKKTGFHQNNEIAYAPLFARLDAIDKSTSSKEARASAMYEIFMVLKQLTNAGCAIEDFKAMLTAIHEIKICGNDMSLSLFTTDKIGKTTLTPDEQYAIRHTIKVTTEHNFMHNNAVEKMYQNAGCGKWYTKLKELFV